MNRRTLSGLGVAAGVLYLLSRAKEAKKVMGPKMLGYAAKVREGAIQAGKEYNLPSWLFIVAGAHESGMGLSKLALEANNFFGVTADNPKDKWNLEKRPRIEMPTTEWKMGVAYKTSRFFRKYASPLESFRDYGRLLTANARYAKVVAQARAGNIIGTFQELTASGYATDPGYGTKLAGVYQAMKDVVA